ncbi:hypothetical protein JXI42_00640 [bacterium]|nr:hypothetical protein [bacterium]
MKILTVFFIIALVLLSVGLLIAQTGFMDEEIQIAKSKPAPMEQSTDIYYIIIDTITILFLLLAVFFGTQLYIYMRGGELTLSWRWLVGATIIFALGKIIEIASVAGLIPQYEWLLRTIYAIVAIFLTLGFLKQRKVLS